MTQIHHKFIITIIILENGIHFENCGISLIPVGPYIRTRLPAHSVDCHVDEYSPVLYRNSNDQLACQVWFLFKDLWRFFSHQFSLVYRFYRDCWTYWQILINDKLQQNKTIVGLYFPLIIWINCQNRFDIWLLFRFCALLFERLFKDFVDIWYNNPC